MNKCIRCFSTSINPNDYGREYNTDLDLCDVCYWRKRAHASIPRADVILALEELRIEFEEDAPEYAWFHEQKQAQWESEKNIHRVDTVMRKLGLNN